jgi:thiol:disulfide interchange protein DsbG
VRSGGLQIRWVPVGIIKRDSEDKAAGILAASDPVAALVTNETAFDHAHEEGGFSVAQARIPPAAIKAVRANDKLMRQAGFYGTPVLLYKTKDGIKALQGLPTSKQLDNISLSTSPPR